MTHMRCINATDADHHLTEGKVYHVSPIPKNDMGRPRIMVHSDDNGRVYRTRAYRFAEVTA